MKENLVVYITVGSEAEAQKISHALVKEKLAACVNIVSGVRSIYSWDGEICDDAELLLIVKTTREALARLTAAVSELHSYDTPEVIALPIVGGLDKYLLWIGESVDPKIDG